MRLPRLTVGRKLLGIVGLNVLGLAVMLALTLGHMRASLMEERELTMKSVVEVAHAVLVRFEQEAASGRLTQDEARRQALTTVKGMRYRGAEYFWVNDMAPRMIMHPAKPELDGQDLTNYKDPDGKHLFVEFVEVVKRSGSGLVAYRWPKPGSDAPIPKISYVKGFAPWGWVIGSGVYLDDVDTVFRQSVMWYSMVALLIAAVGLGLGLVLTRTIARPLGRAADVLERVAAGDFTGRLEVTTRDEVGKMAAALNAALDGMQGALREVRVAADHAATASQELSAASGQLSSGAQQQASSLEETAASLEEITGTVKQNADSARQANELAAASRETAEKGGQVVTDAVAAMGEINRASRKIADIITTIDEIAFQTNLLALNAAVEAARAGEQGRGFAVVAAEVRNLAQRAAAAAKEIKTLIQDSVQKVDAGSALVNRSGQTFQEIVVAVKRVTGIITEITAASQEQTMGIDQVNRAVTLMDQVTQANAAQTEELSSTAQALAGQAQELRTLIGRFKLGTERRRVAPPAAETRVPSAGPPGPARRLQGALELAS